MCIFKLVFYLFLGKYPEAKLLDHMVVLVLIFKEMLYCFPSDCTNLQTTNSALRLPFLRLLFVVFGMITILMAQTEKNLPAMREAQVRSPCQEDLLEKEVAIHFSILA